MKYKTASRSALEAHAPAVAAALTEWRDSGTAEAKHVRRMGAMAQILRELPVGVEISAEALRASAVRLGKSESYINQALIATRAFLRWAVQEQRLQVVLALDSQQQPDTPGLLAAVDELRSIMEAHRVKKRGTAVGNKYIEMCVAQLRAFARWLKKHDPQVEFRSIGQITTTHLMAYQLVLQAGDDKGRELSPKTVYNRLDSLVSVIRAGIKQKKAGFSEANIAGLELDGFEDIGQADRCFTREVIARMYALDFKAATRLPLEQRFVAIRDVTMIMVAYDAALRCDDTVRLTLDALWWDGMTAGGLLPIDIKGGKARSSRAKERLHLTPQAVEYLRPYMDVRSELCRELGLVVEPIKDEKRRNGPVLGVPLFISLAGAGLSTRACSDVFKKVAARAGIKLQKGQSTHCLRHSRITHWVEDGLSLELVCELARHSEIGITREKYYHHSQLREIRTLEEKYGNRQASVTVETLPPEPVLEGLVLAVMRLLGSGKPMLADARRLAAAIRAETDPGALLGEHYTVQEVCLKLKKSRAQIYEDIRAGRLPWAALANGRKAFPKAEIDRIAALRTADAAQMALGLRSRSGLHRLVEDEFIVSERFGGDLRFSDKAIVDAALTRNSSKIRLGVRLKRPAGFVAQNGRPVRAAKGADTEICPTTFANTTMNDQQKPQNALGNV